MPKISEAELQARRESIIDACAKLYETMSFKDITLKEVGKVTTFNRTAIYNYFNTKEEIFLALLQREYELWVADLEGLLAEHASMSRRELAAALSQSLEKRQRLLKLLSMNLVTDKQRQAMEEAEVGFKYYSIYEISYNCLCKLLEVEKQ